MTNRERYQRRYWRRGRRRKRGDLCCTALHSDHFERENPALVLDEVRRGPHGRLRHTYREAGLMPDEITETAIDLIERAEASVVVLREALREVVGHCDCTAGLLGAARESCGCAPCAAYRAARAALRATDGREQERLPW